MIIARDRYLDDSSQYHLSVSLATRTGAMHSLLSNLPDTDRQEIGDILVRALDEIERRLKPALPARVAQASAT
ncbi:MAG TPA: hypothetical protein VK886_23490 [Vicinamibacterales bacterium]|nr:hypothetical protein [Vicinamibacterales bacterium]